MKKLIQERIEIAKAIAAGIPATTQPSGIGGPVMETSIYTVARYAWGVADKICELSEAMAEEEAEAARVAAEEEAERLEFEASRYCQRPVADGFRGPCTEGPHNIEDPCRNADGDTW